MIYVDILFLYLKADDDEENPFGDDFGDNVVSFQVFIY